MSLAQYRPDISQAFQSKVDKWIISNCSLSDDGSIVINENKRKIIKYPETGKWFQYGRRAGKKSYLSDTSLSKTIGLGSERPTPSTRQRYFATPIFSTNTPSRYQSTASTASEDIPNAPFLSFVLDQDQGEVSGSELRKKWERNRQRTSWTISKRFPDKKISTQATKSYLSSSFPSSNGSATEEKSYVSSAIEGGRSLYATGSSLASQASEGYSSAVRSGRNRLANGLESFARSLHPPDSDR